LRCFRRLDETVAEYFMATGRRSRKGSVTWQEGLPALLMRSGAPRWQLTAAQAA
jgi:hypothetical protein